ncbi:hypothetical protein M404DRAFT_1002266 [Pisolithus tinctorius Marx 270]|uniref:Uncharacterized protein n=1 Tax=Pisolithus tinctorius Marx 270 TaxID=870435 RepID=A0A0C3P4Q3_PISTI|nr:hypothetical protein M404DRAFT_1002266 [Pisolithus tinctorius Marx 270]
MPSASKREDSKERWPPLRPPMRPSTAKAPPAWAGASHGPRFTASSHMTSCVRKINSP